MIYYESIILVDIYRQHSFIPMSPMACQKILMISRRAGYLAICSCV